MHATSRNFCDDASLGSHNMFNLLLIYANTAFSALTLLVGLQERHQACKKLSGGVLAWLSV